MATVTFPNRGAFGLQSAGTLMSPREFDRARFEEGWRYELIHGVLVVSPIPSENERDPNEELGHLLRLYRDSLRRKCMLNGTLFEHTIKTRVSRRRADRVIWAGLGRKPRKGEAPTIVVEFVSPGKRARERDYQEKREEYLAIGVKEYWIIDRFERIMTVHIRKGNEFSTRVIQESGTYSTSLLPGFELPLATILRRADFWEGEESESGEEED